MIWATVSSWSSFCWLYRASPSLAAKNIINLISVLTILWCPYVVFSCVVGRGCLLWPVCSLGKTLLAFDLFHFVLQGQICLLLQVSLDFLVLYSYWLNLAGWFSLGTHSWQQSACEWSRNHLKDLFIHTSRPCTGKTHKSWELGLEDRQPLEHLDPYLISPRSCSRTVASV